MTTWERFLELFADQRGDADMMYLWLWTRRFAWDALGRAQARFAASIYRTLTRADYPLSTAAMEDLALASPDGDPFPSAARALRELRAAEVDRPLGVVMDALDATHPQSAILAVASIARCMDLLNHALRGGHSLRHIDGPEEALTSG